MLHQFNQTNLSPAKNASNDSQVPLIARLPLPDQPMVAAALVQKEWAPGETVIKQGDIGMEFFLIKEGQATVISGEKEVAKLRPGDYFGENSLLEDTPRNATIIVPRRGGTMIVALVAFRGEKICRKKIN